MIKKYVIDDGTGALWCDKYWSQIGDYKERASKYNKISGKLMVFIINNTSPNNCHLKKLK